MLHVILFASSHDRLSEKQKQEKEYKNIRRKDKWKV